MPSVFNVNRCVQAPSEPSCLTTSSTVSSLCGQLTDAEHNVGALTAALGQTGQENAQLTGEVSALRTELQKTQTALAASKRSTAGLPARTCHPFAKASTDITTVMSSLQKLQAAITSAGQNAAKLAVLRAKQVHISHKT